MGKTTFLEIKVKGGALYISIIISVIIGVILTFFILISRYNQFTVTKFSQASQLQFNIKSAFEIARSDYFTEEKNDRWIKNQINDDSIRIKKISWGAYLAVAVQTKNRHQRLYQSSLLGTLSSPDTCLYVGDNTRPVGLSGKIEIKGKCYLPAAGIKPAYIEGQSYQSASNFASLIHTSSAEIPSVTDKFRDGIKVQRDKLNSRVDSLVSGVPDLCKNSFNNKTVVIESGSATLSRKTLGGNIKLVCNGSLIIDNSCMFNDILIVCDKIKFKKGFKGSVHVIARDSISMEENCEFEYPSSFVVFNDRVGPTALATIQFNEQCKFAGAVVALSDKASTTNNVFVKLCGGGEIIGSVYSSGFLHLQGKCFGTIFCQKLLLKTPSAVYENHILGCDLDSKKYGQLLAAPLLFKEDKRVVICKNLK
jgi:hypothetical protein